MAWHGSPLTEMLLCYLQQGPVQQPSSGLQGSSAKTYYQFTANVFRKALDMLQVIPASCTSSLLRQWMVCLSAAQEILHFTLYSAGEGRN